MNPYYRRNIHAVIEQQNIVLITAVRKATVVQNNVKNRISLQFHLYYCAHLCVCHLTEQGTLGAHLLPVYSHLCCRCKGRASAKGQQQWLLMQQERSPKTICMFCKYIYILYIYKRTIKEYSKFNQLVLLAFECCCTAQKDNSRF